MPVYEVQSGNEKYRLESDRDLSPEEIEAELGDLQPAPVDSGQGYGTSLLSSAGRGFTSIVPGTIGGVGVLTGSDTLTGLADDIEGGINEILPVNPIYQDDFAMKAAGAVGQVGSVLATGGLGGAVAKGLGGANAVARGAMAANLGSGFLQGVRGGAQDAEKYGMEGSEAYGRALLGGALEAGTEFLPFGQLTESTAARRMLGEAIERGTGRFLKDVGTEAAEEVASQVGGNLANTALAAEGVETPAFYEGALEAGALGGIGGGIFGGINELTGRANAPAEQVVAPEVNPDTEFQDEATLEKNRLQASIESGQTPIPPEMAKPIVDDPEAAMIAPLVQELQQDAPLTAQALSDTLVQTTLEKANAPQPVVEATELEEIAQTPVQPVPEIQAPEAIAETQTDLVPISTDSVLAGQEQGTLSEEGQLNGEGVNQQDTSVSATQASSFASAVEPSISQDGENATPIIETTEAELPVEEEPFSPPIAEAITRNREPLQRAMDIMEGRLPVSRGVQAAIPQQERTAEQHLDAIQATANVPGDPRQRQIQVEQEVRQTPVKRRKEWAQMLGVSDSVQDITQALMDARPSQGVRSVRQAFQPLPEDVREQEIRERKRIKDALMPQGVRAADGRPLRSGITIEDANNAVQRLIRQIPGVGNAWIGTAEEYQAETGSLPPAEAFFDPESDRAVILTDRVQLREGDERRARENRTTPEVEAVKRLLRHESFVHRGWQSLPSSLREEFLNLSDSIVSKEELDALVSSGYSRYRTWRENNATKALAVEEWLAQRLERVQTIPKSGPVAEFMDWLKRVWHYLTGQEDSDPTLPELKSLMRSMHKALSVREASKPAQRSPFGNDESIRYSVANEDQSIPVDQAQWLVSKHFKDPTNPEFWPKDLRDQVEYQAEQLSDYFTYPEPFFPEEMRQKAELYQQLEVQRDALLDKEFPDTPDNDEGPDLQKQAREQAAAIGRQMDILSGELEDMGKVAADALIAPVALQATERAEAAKQAIEQTGLYRWNEKLQEFDNLGNPQVRYSLPEKMPEIREIAKSISRQGTMESEQKLLDPKVSGVPDPSKYVPMTVEGNRKAGEQIVSLLSPNMKDWPAELANPDFRAGLQQDNADSGRALLDNVYLTAMQRVMNASFGANTSEGEHASLQATNALLSKEYQAIQSSRGQVLALAGHTKSDPKYAPMFAVMAAQDKIREVRDGVLDNVVPSGTSEAVQDADNLAKIAALEETVARLQEEELVDDLGIASQTPEVRAKIQQLSESIRRRGVLARAIQRMQENVRMSASSIAALDAEFAGLTVEEMYAKVAEEDAKIVALTTELTKVAKTTRKARKTTGKATDRAKKGPSAPKPMATAKSILARLKGPTEAKTKTPNPVREFFKKHMAEPMEEEDFIEGMVALGVDAPTSQELFDATEVAIAAHEVAKEQRKAKKSAEAEEAANKQASRLIYRTEEKLRQGSKDLSKSTDGDSILKAFREQVAKPMEQQAFRDRLQKLGVKEEVSDRLFLTASREAVDKTIAKEQQRVERERLDIEIANERASRIIYKADERIGRGQDLKENASGDSVNKAFREQVKSPLERQEFRDRLAPFKITTKTADRLFDAAQRETQDLEFIRDMKSRQRFIAEDSTPLRSLLNDLREKITGPITWSELFAQPQATQQEWRQEIYNRIRKHEALQNLSPGEARKLAIEMDRIWGQNRRKEFAKQMKRVLPGAIKPVNREKIVDAVPALLKLFNLGIFNSESFRDAIAPKFGLRPLNSEDVRRLGELAQKAQAADLSTPERTRYLQEMTELMQDVTKATRAEIFSNYWITSVLSGSRTLFETSMAAMNGLRVIGQLSAYTAATRKGGAKAFSQAWWNYMKAFANGIPEAAAYFVSGDLSLLDSAPKQFSDLFNEGAKGANPFGLAEKMRKSNTGLAKVLPTFMVGVERAMRVADHLNSMSTAEGMKPLAIAMSPELYEKARLPTAKDEQMARERAVAILGHEPHGLLDRARISSYTRQILNDSFLKPESEGGQGLERMIDEVRDIGYVAAYQNDPSGVGGIIYRTLLNFTRGIRDHALKNKLKGEALGEDQTKADRLGREMYWFLANQARAMTGTQFVRFTGNKFNELVSFTPGLGYLMRGIQEDNKTASRNALLVTNQLVGTAVVMAVFGAMLKFLDDDDEEDQPISIEGSWDNLTPERKKQRMSAGFKPLTINFKVGDQTHSFNYQNWPISSLLATLGALNDMKRFTPDKWTEKGAGGKIAAAAGAGVFAIKDLSSISAFTDMLGQSAFSTDPTDSFFKGLNKWAANYTGGIYPRALKDLDLVLKPEVNTTKDWWGAWTKEMPFFRRYIGSPMLDVFGKEVQLRREPWSRSYSQSPVEPEYSALADLEERGLWLGGANPDNRTVGSGMNRRELTDAEKTAYIKEVGSAYKQFVLANSERILKMDFEQGKEFISKRTEKLRDLALTKAMQQTR